MVGTDREGRLGAPVGPGVDSQVEPTLLSRRLVPVGPDPGVGRDVFVGRRRELAKMAVALRPSRHPAIVAISGAAGIGKTALAREAAARLAVKHGYEVSRLDLTSGVTALAFDVALGRALAAESLDPAAIRLVLGCRRQVVLIDGADDRLREVADSLAALADEPALRVIVTSVRRTDMPEPLRPVTTEIVLGALDLPPPQWDPVTDPAEYSGLELFKATAASLLPDADFDPTVLSEMARVCRAVDGLPLAIVLAAARLSRPLGLEHRLSRQIQADPGFALALGTELTPRGSDPSLPSSGREGVREALARTHRSLDPLGRRVWERTSVFEGPFGLSEAEALCGQSRYSLLEPLEELVALRVIASDPDSETASQPRFVMRALSRAFARSELEQHAALAEATEAHAEYFAAFAHRSSERYNDCQLPIDPLVLAAEPDLYRALDYLIERGRPSCAVALAADMGHVAFGTGHLPELLHRLNQLLGTENAGATEPVDSTANGLAPGHRAEEDVDRRARAFALLWAAQLGAQSMTSPDTIGQTRLRWSQGMELARALQEPLLLLRGFAGAILALPVTSEFARAAAAATEGRALAEQIGHVRWLARFTAWSGMVAHQKGDFDGASQAAADALGMALRSDDRSTQVLVGLLVSGMDPTRAPVLPLLPDLEELLSMAVDLGDRYTEPMLLGQLAARAAEKRDDAACARWNLRRIPLIGGSHSWHAYAVSVILAGLVASHRGDYRLAARLHGALLPTLDVVSAGLGSRDRAGYEAEVRFLRVKLGATTFETEARRGSQLSLSGALGEAIPLLTEVAQGDGTAAPDGERALTTREREVLGCLAEGLSNKDIAKRLGVSQKTVMHHTSAIYRKLGVRGRAEAALIALRTTSGAS